MNLLRIVGLCLAAALVCAAIRSSHPQIAAAVALACAVGVMLLSLEDMGSFARVLGRMEEALRAQGGGMELLRLCGVSLVAELASDVCRDAGEGALARRIDMGVRLGVAAAALPAASRLMDCVAELVA